MVLEERKCPNCGSNEILEKNGTFVCMNCRTFFDNPNDLKITTRDETEIEKARSKERTEKSDNISFTIIFVGLLLLMAVLCVLDVVRKG